MSFSPETIQVAIRMRPLTSPELNRGEFPIWEMDDKAGEIRQMRCATGKSFLTFPFKTLFGPDTTNVHVYERLVRDIVNSSLEGVVGK